MNKQFVIATNAASPSIKNEITAFIKGKNWEFWHWFDDLWLLADVGEEYTARKIYEEVLMLSPEARNLTIVVFDMIKKSDRSFFGKAVPSSWDWTIKHWGKAK